jgi:hypothetical protein
MKNWKIGFLIVGSVALLVSAGAGGRAAIGSTPAGDIHVQAPHSPALALADRQPTAAADSDTGPGCAESGLNQR